MTLEDIRNACLLNLFTITIQVGAGSTAATIKGEDSSGRIVAIRVPTESLIEASLTGRPDPVETAIKEVISEFTLKSTPS